LLSVHDFRPFVVEFGCVAPIWLGLMAIYYRIKDILFRDSAKGLTPVNPRILRGNITTSRSVFQ
jgi:hypothetical protein